MSIFCSAQKEVWRSITLSGTTGNRTQKLLPQYNIHVPNVTYDICISGTNISAKCSGDWINDVDVINDHAQTFKFFLTVLFALFIIKLVL